MAADKDSKGGRPTAIAAEPDVIQGFTPDPALGLQLKFALTFYGAEPDGKDFRGKSILARYQWLSLPASLRLGATLTPSELAERHGLQTMYRMRLVDLLRSGALVLRGFRLRSLDVEEPPPEWFTDVRLDEEVNTAEANGLKLTGVLIFSPTEFPIEGHSAGPMAGRQPAPDAQPAPKMQRPKKKTPRRKIIPKQELPVWELIKEDALDWLRENGVPIAGDEQQTQFEKEIARLLLLRKTTHSESTIRVHAKKYIRAFSTPIQIEPGKAGKADH